jgi:hypothetical protein
MSPRKPTIDDIDDIDDEDGVLEDEAEEENDLTLLAEDEDEVGLGGAPDEIEASSEDDLDEEEEG